jgi:hypothetical protein
MTGLLRAPARLGPLFLFGILVALLVAIEHAVVHWAKFSQHPALAPAVVFDLLVILPGLFYGCVVRHYQLPLSTIAAVFGGGLALSHWLLPTAGLPVLAWTGRVASVLEVGTLGYAAVRARRLRRAYQAAQTQSADFLDNLHSATEQVLGRLGGVIATEFALGRYALLGGWARPEIGTAEVAFSTYQKSGFVALLATAAGLSVVEMAAAHLVIGHWYPRVAWGLTIPSGYSLLWLLAHGQAVRCRPVLVSPQELVVRVGMIWRVAIPFSNIIGIQSIAGEPRAEAGQLNAARLLLVAPNLLLTLAAPQVVRGPYGVCRTVRRLAIYVDEPQRLQQQLGALVGPPLWAS